MKNLIAITLFCLSLFTFGQEEIKKEQAIRKNAFYFELGGNGGIYSVNYDRIILSSKIAHLSLRAGFSGYPNAGFITESYVLPFEVNLLLGKENNFFELGVGKSIVNESNNDSDNLTTFRFGYRYISYKGLMVRAGVVPFVFSLFGNDVVGIWGGLSVGYAF